MYMACLDGQGGFSYEGLAALKTHVSLQEALEIEAIKCAAGDARHEFQNFYSAWLAEQHEASSDLSKLGKLDAEKLLEEIEMTRQAIDEHESLLAECRLAILDKKPPPLSEDDRDATQTLVDAFKLKLPRLHAEYARLLAASTPTGGSVSERRSVAGDAQLEPLRKVGPSQSGELRPTQPDSPRTWQPPKGGR